MTVTRHYDANEISKNFEDNYDCSTNFVNFYQYDFFFIFCPFHDVEIRSSFMEPTCRFYKIIKHELFIVKYSRAIAIIFFWTPRSVGDPNPNSNQTRAC